MPVHQCVLGTFDLLMQVYCLMHPRPPLCECRRSWRGKALGITIISYTSARIPATNGRSKTWRIARCRGSWYLSDMAILFHRGPGGQWDCWKGCPLRTAPMPLTWTGAAVYQRRHCEAAKLQPWEVQRQKFIVDILQHPSKSFPAGPLVPSSRDWRLWMEALPSDQGESWSASMTILQCIALS